jgi:hypothetical protein
MVSGQQIYGFVQFVLRDPKAYAYGYNAQFFNIDCAANRVADYSLFSSAAILR